ncbi:hypothetical protein JSY36_04725 [Bacillus sp. H-16]|uniref:hypothetical protein n=1 Tax=Alteribacter salitolerans TaxID=2912333 RepID=UPI001965E1FF|nr:hypothetical protein [Alteribacter salitolerans]MBM7095056.1 hypothetical protein [Alteribacter salitolerans]
MTKKKWTVVQFVSFVYIVGLLSSLVYFGNKYQEYGPEFSQNYPWVLVLIGLSAVTALLFFSLGFAAKKDGGLKKGTVVATVLMVLLLGLFLYFSRT